MSFGADFVQIKRFRRIKIMGLIKAAWSAASGALADQWKEYFYCDALDADVLVAKGVKQISGRSSNS